jgi:PadR family transcriptional regulator, regulatory protein PadR
MKDNNQLYKGALNTILLKMLKENGKMYGYEITKKVREITSNEINLTEGALYPALHKLEADGMLDVTVEKVDNRPRKYYNLTKKGKSATAVKIEEFNAFITQMNLLLNLKPAAR